jgi:hypothetical protein
MTRTPYVADLCRGDEVLGALAALPLRLIGKSASSKQWRHLHAAIIARPPFGRLQPMMQHRSPIVPGEPIFQNPIPPQYFPPQRRHVSPSSATREFPLRPMSAEEARGVPSAQLLVISTADRQRFVPAFLSVDQLIIAPGAPLPPDEPIPEGALIDGSFWTVLARFDAESAFPFPDLAHDDA